LSNVILINGSEPVNLDSINKFIDAFVPHGLSKTAVRPSYGMAEATLFVSSIQPHTEPTAVYLDREQLGVGRAVRVTPDAPNALAQVSCGRVSVSQWAVIVDPDSGQEVPDECIGEIWLHGDNIGRGYWYHPEETEHTFGNKLQARLDSGSHAEGASDDAMWLRTGDLGVYIDGELYITGRIKDVVIIRGTNHYPQDIERTVERAHPALRPHACAAFAASVDGEERLVVVQELERTSRRGADIDEVVGCIREAVANAHDIAVHEVVLLAPGGVPKTTSGKIQRSLARQLWRDGRLDVIGGDRPAAERP
jgi:fatty-acyl-CoA synthase